LDTALIEKLARLRGIGDAYHDYRGELRYFTLETKAGILRAMGCPVDDPAKLEAELRDLERMRSRSLLPRIASARGPRIGVDINVSAREFGATLLWSVSLEDGSRRSGSISTADCPETWRGEVEGGWVTRRRFEVPLDLPPGYHELQANIAANSHRCLIIPAPTCYEPPAIVQGRKLWGVAVQLYSLRSQANWGIGDFHDLKLLTRWLAARGAGFIGLNPLHALAPADPERSSPYSASSRHFLNVLYIAVPEVPEFQECAAAALRAADPLFTQRLAALRASSHVDYRGVAGVKFEILELLYHHFREQHLAVGSERARMFRDFAAAGGLLLRRHACFDALDRHFCETLGTPSGWLCWPAEFHDADGEAAMRFAETHPAEVEFHVYLQWLAHEQLAGVQSLTRDLGMPIGLYGDYAVGANPSGSETWVDRTSYRMGAEIGAPPDPLALKGQGWGIPPQDPFAMENQRLQGFVSLIRHNMRCYGALRLDHVMSLFRLWWVPGGCSPTAGAYVHYPLHQLLCVLAVESRRASCLVVGEDLGVVPDEIRRAMPEFGLYHYKVLLFEKQDGRFREPVEFVRRALATVTTHDMPPLRSYWEGLDIELRRQLHLYPSTEMHDEVLRERELDRVALLAALRDQGLAPAQPATSGEPYTPELAQALHLYLARSASVLAALQIEDLLGMVDPVNIPGTDREYPNWQRKITMDIEDMAMRADFDAYFAAINQARS
jgi:4-alpha-glucanotransferase